MQNAAVLFSRHGSFLNTLDTKRDTNPTLQGSLIGIFKEQETLSGMETFMYDLNSASPDPLAF